MWRFGEGEDRIRSTRIITDSTGAPCYDADFFPFGGIQHEYLNTCPQNYKFTGKERDSETGFDEFGARYYSSTWGRFTIPDWDAKPAAVPYAKFGDPQTLNLYSYVENSPVDKADADGHSMMGGGSCGCERDAELNDSGSGVDTGGEGKNYGALPDQAAGNQPQGGQNASVPGQTDAAQSTNTQQVGNVVHNETGGLRPEANEGSGSSQDLHNAKVAVSDVIENREKAGINGGVASDKVSPKERSTPQYKDAQQAAAEAARSPNVTGGSKNFYLDYGQPSPKWAQGKYTTSYGPFKNAAGGGDVPKDHDVRIIIVHPEDQQ